MKNIQKISMWFQNESGIVLGTLIFVVNINTPSLVVSSYQHNVSSIVSHYNYWECV